MAISIEAIAPHILSNRTCDSRLSQNRMSSKDDAPPFSQFQPFSCSRSSANTDCRGDPANRSDKLMATPCRVRKVAHLLARSSPLSKTKNEPKLLLNSYLCFDLFGLCMDSLQVLVFFNCYIVFLAAVSIFLAAVLFFKLLYCFFQPRSSFFLAAVLVFAALGPRAQGLRAQGGPREGPGGRGGIGPRAQ